MENCLVLQNLSLFVLDDDDADADDADGDFFLRPGVRFLEQGSA